MPHFVGNILVASKQELIPSCFPSYPALKMKLKRYEALDYGPKRFSKGGNGRKLLVLFDSLEPKHQEILGDPRKKQHALQAIYKRTSTTYNFYTNFKYADGSYLIDPEQYIINATVLIALIKQEELRTANRIALRQKTRDIPKSLWSDSKTFNKYLIQVGEKPYQEGRAHTLNGSYPRWKKQYDDFKLLYNAGKEKEAYESIMKDIDQNSKKNAQKMNDATIKLLNEMFAEKKKPSIPLITKKYQGFLNGTVEIANKETGEYYEPKDFAPISARTIRHWLKKWENQAPNEYGRSADRQKFMQKYIPYESMANVKFAGSILSIDDRQPPFEYAKGKRMWWYLGIDLASEAFTCWSYGKAKEGIIINFYKNMIRQYHSYGVNISHQLECESSLNSSFRSTFLKEGALFKDVDIHPNSARSKRIERWFRELRLVVEKKHPHWLGRPFALSESNQERPVAKKEYIPYNQLVQQCLYDIYEWNNSEHTKIKGKTRWEVFMESQNPKLKPTNYKAVLPHLGALTPTSCNAGIIKLQSKEWLLGDDGEIYTGSHLINLLKKVEGKDIDIRWIDGIDGEVIKALVYMNDRLICEALPKPIGARASIEATEEQRQAREIMARYRNTVTAYIQQQSGARDELVVIDNTPKMLNTKFQMPGLNATFKPRTTPVESIEDEDEKYEYAPKTKTKTKGIHEAFGL